MANFRRYANRAPTSFGEAVLAGATGIPTTGAPGSTFTNPITGETFVLVIPGFGGPGTDADAWSLPRQSTFSGPAVQTTS